jgi:hypothetical protein
MLLVPTIPPIATRSVASQPASGELTRGRGREATEKDTTGADTVIKAERFREQVVAYIFTHEHMIAIPL